MCMQRLPLGKQNRTQEPELKCMCGLYKGRRREATGYSHSAVMNTGKLEKIA